MLLKRWKENCVIKIKIKINGLQIFVTCIKLIPIPQSVWCKINHDTFPV